MCATTNSTPVRHFRRVRLFVLALSTLQVGESSGGETSTNKVPALSFAAQSAKVHLAARQHYEASPTNRVAAWEFARACFDRAEYATNNAERAAIAMQGIAACR